MNGPVYVMLRRTEVPERAPQFIEAHLRWMIEAERRGLVFTSGPFIAAGVTPGRPGSPAGGMTILRAESLEAARRIAQEDPYVLSGTVSYEMKEWLVMEGSVQIRVSFSDGSYEMT